MIDAIAILSGTTGFVGVTAMGALTANIRLRRDRDRWRAKYRQQVGVTHDSDLMAQYWLEEHDKVTATNAKLTRRLFRAKAMTPTEASAFASEMGKRGRAKQLARKEVA